MQFDMARAWKDEEYRQSLSQEQQTQLLESPAGEVELSEAELEQINGTGGYGGGGGVGKGGVTQGYGFAGGIVGNSYYCGNFSIQPRTNLNLGSSNKGGTSLGDIGSEITSRLSTRSDIRTNRFDFSCSASGGLAGTCLFGGGN